uniref:Uncharacterized protein n=1 Tax=Brassica campestris TaxID=3711 RepID=M4CWC9_BRACM
MMNNNNNNNRGGKGIGAGRGAFNPNPNFQSRPGYQQQQHQPQYVQRGGGYSHQNQQQFQQATSQPPRQCQSQWLPRPQFTGRNGKRDEVEKTVQSQAIDTNVGEIDAFLSTKRQHTSTPTFLREPEEPELELQTNKATRLTTETAPYKGEQTEHVLEAQSLQEAWYTQSLRLGPLRQRSREYRQRGGDENRGIKGERLKLKHIGRGGRSTAKARRPPEER